MTFNAITASELLERMKRQGIEISRSKLYS
ncbi:DNA-binding protein, partial [Listeria monocytogenes]|nr:DNA-binding protein [Listeria monocytogenes]